MKTIRSACLSSEIAHPRILSRIANSTRLAVCALILLNATNAIAWTPNGGKLRNNTYNYRVNLNSFVSPPSGGGNFVAGTTATEYAYWIAEAASVWKERTGANISIVYDGTISRNGEVDCDNADTTYEIMGATSCGQSMCPLAVNFVTISASGVVVDSDICVFRGTTTGLYPWRIQTNGFPQGNFDLIGVLTHEIGHAMGSADDTSGTVMNSSVLDVTFNRFPTGGDINGMRALYGTKIENAFWRSSTSGGPWSAAGSVAGAQTNLALAGAQGASGAGAKVVVGLIDPTFQDRV